MNYPQKPVLPTAAQTSVHSQEVKAGSEHIIRMGKPEGIVVFHDTKYSSESELMIYKPMLSIQFLLALPSSGAYQIISIKIQVQFLGLILWLKKLENLGMNYKP
ncbi:MAG: hypothetical protein EZS28_006204 [Streblomastix strix]|uniref:Uncharacterized protein n=1 Tax=Streblomastix strix TaxID=222440 RepID=A0A5J4WTZ0_9EUKA|nr:MAG: hypothetical protein EZS28_006204 [Streblomastix strix]